MGSDTDSDWSEIDPEGIAIYELTKKRRMNRMALSPRVVMEAIDISPGTLAAFKSTPPMERAEFMVG